MLHGMKGSSEPGSSWGCKHPCTSYQLCFCRWLLLRSLRISGWALLRGGCWRGGLRHLSARCRQALREITLVRGTAAPREPRGHEMRVSAACWRQKPTSSTCPPLCTLSLQALAGWGASGCCGSSLPPGWLCWGQDWEDLEDACFPAEQEAQRDQIHQILTPATEMLLAAHTVAAPWASPGRRRRGSTNLWRAGERPGRGTPTSLAGHDEGVGSVSGAGHESARAGSLPGRLLAPCRVKDSPRGKFRLAGISGATSHPEQGQRHCCIALEQYLPRLLPLALRCAPQLSLASFVRAGQPPRPQGGHPVGAALSPDPQPGAGSVPFSSPCPLPSVRAPTMGSRRGAAPLWRTQTRRSSPGQTAAAPAGSGRFRHRSRGTAPGTATAPPALPSPPPLTPSPGTSPR